MAADTGRKADWIDEWIDEPSAGAILADGPRSKALIWVNKAAPAGKNVELHRTQVQDVRRSLCRRSDEIRAAVLRFLARACLAAREPRKRRVCTDGEPQPDER